MRREIIGEQLANLIGESKVVAALFYTFNFEPEFFENYVMPLLLPGKEFSDNKIHNSIIWRRYYAEDIVPPVTVYYDEKVKNNSIAPQLEYKIHSVKLSNAFFHPKNSFILTEDDRLIIIGGSNNISAAGWNTNLEAVTCLQLKLREYYPKETRDLYRRFIEFVAENNSLESSDAEELILTFLRKRLYEGEPVPFYSTTDESGFNEFLNEYIPNGDSVEKIEVIAPFISSNTVLIDKLKTICSDAEIYLWAPNNKERYIELEKDVYDKYKEKGVFWCRLKNSVESPKVHAKVYRFLTKDKVYCIIGSVNFTEQAWGLNVNRNIESAHLITETDVNPYHLLEPQNFDDYNFIGVHENEEDNLEAFYTIYPDVEFSIDWYKKQLIAVNKDDKYIKVELPDKIKKEVLKGKSVSIPLTPDYLKAYAEKSIVKVLYNKNVLYYYMNHLNIEFKPLSNRIRFSENEILGIWNNLSPRSINISQERINRILERYISEEGDLDPNGIIDESSTLNKMALNLSAIINLERYLFKEENLSDIKYYLTLDNPDCVPYFINQIEEKVIKKSDEGGTEINHGFYWLILKIIHKEFYSRRGLKTRIKDSGSDFISAMDKMKQRIELILKQMESTEYLNLDSRLIEWVNINIKHE